MSNKNSNMTTLDLSRADGNIHVDPEAIKRATFTSESIAMLPTRDSYIRLKESIARYYSFPQEGIVLGNGSDELIESIAREKRGGIALTLVPSFERLFEVGDKFGYETSTYALSVTDNYDYTESVHERLLGEVERLRPDVIWMCSPNNPSGAIVTPDHVRQIAAKSKNAWVVVDAAFADISSRSLLMQYGSLVHECKNLIVLSSFSKSWGIAALRLGFVLASSEIATTIARHSVMFNINTMAVEVAQYCIDNDSYRYKEFERLRRAFDAIQESINGMPYFEIIANTDLNLFCIRHLNHPDLHKQLLRLGIKTKSLDNMPGMENKGFCRIAIPRNSFDTERLLAALSSIR